MGQPRGRPTVRDSTGDYDTLRRHGTRYRPRLPSLRDFKPRSAPVRGGVATGLLSGYNPMQLPLPSAQRGRAPVRERVPGDNIEIDIQAGPQFLNSILDLYREFHLGSLARKDNAAHLDAGIGFVADKVKGRDGSACLNSMAKRPRQPLIHVSLWPIVG